MERFKSKYALEPNTGCHLWTASTDQYGYGQFWSEGTVVKAHRFAWEQANGPIPDGMQAHHECGIVSCVNPEHLVILTAETHRSKHTTDAKISDRPCRNGHYDMRLRADGRGYECRVCKRRRRLEREKEQKMHVRSRL